MALKIDKVGVENVCKEIIETILFCLPDAFKGTVYRIGKPPELLAKRITSGIIDEQRQAISWGLPQRSDYNPPGKPWVNYRDEPSRPLEAMAWCVENQKSWTSENPKHDARSVRLQVDGSAEDFHHMEPVLIRKEDLYLAEDEELHYPTNYEGKTLWQDTEFIVSNVIKIHFRPNTIKIGSPETKLIKKLSRSLGTELLSYQLREQSVETMRKLAEDRLNSCNILADSLRNAITKTGLIFSLIKLELSFLRQQWEEKLLENSDMKGLRSAAIYTLNRALELIPEIPDEVAKNLREAHDRFLRLFLPPELGENWVRMRIEETWDGIFKTNRLDEEQTTEIRSSIDQLKRSVHLGKDPDLLAGYTGMSDAQKQEWIDLIYKDVDSVDLGFFDKLIQFLKDPSLDFPYQDKSRKSLKRLKGIAETVGQLEEQTNTVLRQVLNGHDEATISNVLNGRNR